MGTPPARFIFTLQYYNLEKATSVRWGVIFRGCEKSREWICEKGLGFSFLDLAKL